MSHVIETENLTKIYGAHYAVNRLDWAIEPGTACAFLGPNGAGKSTTLRMLLGFLAPSRGTCRVLGVDPWDMTPELRSRVAYVAENSILPPWMRVDKLIAFHRSLFRGWNDALARELLDVLEVPTQQRVAELSKGQNRRLSLLLALAQGPELLILDEPGSGLDVGARRQALALLSDFLAEEGRTLLFSTHLVSDVERIASRVAIMDRGRLVADSDLDELHENVKSVEIPREFFDRTRERWEAAGILALDIGPREVVLSVRHFASQGRFIMRDLSAGEVIVSESNACDVYVGSDGAEARVLNLSLEDVFLALTNTQENVPA